MLLQYYFIAYVLSLNLCFLIHHTIYLLLNLVTDLECVEGLMLWRDSSHKISDEITQGYLGNRKFQLNEITAGNEITIFICLMILI
jgi:hypothetical protein